MTHSHHELPGAEDRPLPEFSPMQKVKRRFFAMRNGALAAQLRTAGLNYGVNFGLNIPQIKEIAAETRDSGLSSLGLMRLAEALWDNVTTRESRLLAPMLYPADIMPRELAARWLAEAQTVEVADHLCHSLLRQLPCALDLASEAAARPDATDMQRYAALRLLLNLLCTGKADARTVAEAAAPLRADDSALLRPLLRQIDQELEWLAEEE